MYKAFVLSIPQFTASDYPFGIFKPFFELFPTKGTEDLQSK